LVKSWLEHFKNARFWSENFDILLLKMSIFDQNVVKNSKNFACGAIQLLS